VPVGKSSQWLRNRAANCPSASLPERTGIVSQPSSSSIETTVSNPMGSSSTTNAQRATQWVFFSRSVTRLKFFIKFFYKREQPGRQFFGRIRPIVVPQLLADSFSGLIPMEPFA
jgi:hypothetical protein